jgi:preprotein translocase subunit SecD
MFNSLKARFLLILAAVALCAWFLYSRGITLGLDLQGGSHLALEVEDVAGTMTAQQRADATDQALQIIRTRIDELGVAEPVIQKSGADRIILELPGIKDEGRAKEIVQRTAFLKFQIVRPLDELQTAMPRMDRAVADAFGAEAAATADTGAAPAPGVGGLIRTVPEGDSAAAAGESAAAVATDTAVATHPLSSKLIPTGQVGQFAVADADVAAVQRYLELPAVQRLLPRGTEFRWGMPPRASAAAEAPGYRILYLLDARPIMTGEYLQDAQAQRDPQFNRPIVTFELNRRGGRIFERATGENVHNLMAIVLDERVYSAPVINSQIGNRGQIEMGGGSIEEARDLALVLRAGALPAPIKIVEERTVGPSLGADSIAKGQFAAIVGTLLVVFIMVGYYRFAGVMAVGALVLYVAFVLGGLAGVGATLTLPGIAALVLSIGMAVDANVLIFERVREEIAAGKSPRIAVNEGFSNALSAIIDSQLTTLITAFVLFQFGTGPIRGFAVTLTIGIIASMFTAIFVTRTFFLLYLERRPATAEISI